MGEPDKAIARRLAKSTSLVHKRVRELHATLGTQNRVQLTLVAMAYGLAPMPRTRFSVRDPDRVIVIVREPVHEVV